MPTGAPSVLPSIRTLPLPDEAQALFSRAVQLVQQRPGDFAPVASWLEQHYSEDALRELCERQYRQGYAYQLWQLRRDSPTYNRRLPVKRDRKWLQRKWEETAWDTINEALHRGSRWTGEALVGRQRQHWDGTVSVDEMNVEGVWRWQDEQYRRQFREIKAEAGPKRDGKLSEHDHPDQRRWRLTRAVRELIEAEYPDGAEHAEHSRKVVALAALLMPEPLPMLGELGAWSFASDLDLPATPTGDWLTDEVAAGAAQAAQGPHGYRPTVVDLRKEGRGEVLFVRMPGESRQVRDDFPLDELLKLLLVAVDELESLSPRPVTMPSLALPADGDLLAVLGALGKHQREVDAMLDAFAPGQAPDDLLAAQFNTPLEDATKWLGNRTDISREDWREVAIRFAMNIGFEAWNSHTRGKFPEIQNLAPRVEQWNKPDIVDRLKAALAKKWPPLAGASASSSTDEAGQSDTAEAMASPHSPQHNIRDAAGSCRAVVLIDQPGGNDDSHALSTPQLHEGLYLGGRGEEIVINMAEVVARLGLSTSPTDVTATAADVGKWASALNLAVTCKLEVVQRLKERARRGGFQERGDAWDDPGLRELAGYLANIESYGVRLSHLGRAHGASISSIDQLVVRRLFADAPSLLRAMTEAKLIATLIHVAPPDGVGTEGKKATLQGPTTSDSPDAQGFVANPSDKNAYRAANKIINDHPGVAKDIKALNAILADHPEIRRWKPRQNRLSVHAGDWLKYVDAQAQGRQFTPEGTHAPSAKFAGLTAGAMKAPPAIRAWRCRKCRAEYPDQPATCKCGGGDFEPVIARPSTPQ